MQSKIYLIKLGATKKPAHSVMKIDKNNNSLQSTCWAKLIRTLQENGRYFSRSGVSNVSMSRSVKYTVEILFCLLPTEQT